MHILLHTITILLLSVIFSYIKRLFFPLFCQYSTDRFDIRVKKIEIFCVKFFDRKYDRLI